MAISHFIHSSVGYLDCFLLTIVNSAAMNFYVQVFFEYLFSILLDVYLLVLEGLLQRQGLAVAHHGDLGYLSCALIQLSYVLQGILRSGLGSESVLGLNSDDCYGHEVEERRWP